MLHDEIENHIISEKIIILNTIDVENYISGIWTLKIYFQRV